MNGHRSKQFYRTITPMPSDLENENTERHLLPGLKEPTELTWKHVYSLAAGTLGQVHVLSISVLERPTKLSSSDVCKDLRHQYFLPIFPANEVSSLQLTAPLFPKLNKVRYFYNAPKSGMLLCLVLEITVSRQKSGCWEKKSE